MTWQLLLKVAIEHQRPCAAAAALAVLGVCWLRVVWEYGRRGRSRAPVRWYTVSRTTAAERPDPWDLRELQRSYPEEVGGPPLESPGPDSVPDRVRIRAPGRHQDPPARC